MTSDHTTTESPAKAPEHLVRLIDQADAEALTAYLVRNREPHRPWSPIPPEGFFTLVPSVEAGRAGHFGAVVGVDRVGHAQALSEHGATIVVQDLAELLG